MLPGHPIQRPCSLKLLISKVKDMLVFGTSFGYPRPSGLVGIGAACLRTVRLAREREVEVDDDRRGGG